MRIPAVKLFVAIATTLIFAMPLLLLLVGVMTTPLWIAGALGDRDNSRMFLLCTLGGCLGMFAIYRMMRYWLSSDQSRKFEWRLIPIYLVVGLTSLWVMFTRGFTKIPYNWAGVVYLIAPTSCALLIAYLAARKFRSGEAAGGPAPNTNVENDSRKATRVSSRALED